MAQHSSRRPLVASASIVIVLAGVKPPQKCAVFIGIVYCDYLLTFAGILTKEKCLIVQR